jgi:tRNA(fMet)-specific endonuclease VapC
MARLKNFSNLPHCVYVLFSEADGNTNASDLPHVFKCGSNESKNTAEIEEFLDSPRVSFVPSDADTAPFYADIYKRLRHKGKPIPTNDMWIAASAMQHGCAVCSRDRYFEHVDGLLTVIL